jgi:hypothetical protein
VFRLDRGGLGLGRFTVTAPGGAPRVIAVTHEKERFLALRGGETAALAPFLDPGKQARATLGGDTPAPPLAEGRWSAIAHAPDGTLWLVSSGDPAVLAWRAP